MHGIQLEPYREFARENLKVEFNDGYALADSRYFSYCDGDMLLLPGYDGECVIKAFYRKKRNKKKVKEILEELQNVVKS